MAVEWVQRIGGVRAQRSRHEWSDIFPVVLRSAIHARVTTGRFRQPWSERLVLIKWVIDGQAAIGVSGRRLTFGPGDVAIYSPTQPHQFWSLQEGTEMCWFSVDGPLAEQFVHLLGLRAGVHPYGPAPVDRVEELIRSFDDQSLDGCRQSSQLAIRFLYDIAAKLPQPQTVSIVRQVRHIVREGLADPQLSAARIASRLNYNRGALSRMFRKHSGMTIMECITQTRLQEAEMLLAHTSERIGDVARKCGFEDMSYFTRWIKKHTGKLPRDVRAATDARTSAPDESPVTSS
jgi:AraC-like DNA-binding protein